MKKFLFVVLMAALAIPMMQAQLQATKGESKRKVLTQRDAVLKTNPIQAFDWSVRPATPMLRGDATYMWDFETDESFAGWMSYDYDGDGIGWSYDESGDYAHSGSTCLISESYSFYYGALDPDNWLISPEVPLNGTLSIWAAAGFSWYPDMFAVYVCVGEFEDVTDFVKISDDIYPGDAWEEYTFDLSAYAGQTGYFAIRHFDSPDMYFLMIDDISLTGPAVSVPENLTADPDVTTADVAWEDAENPAWNLRYREVVPGIEENLLWDFEEDTNDNENIELTGGWSSIDADGDGNGWYHLYGSNFVSHSGKGVVTSASYQGDPLFPDNWLVSPEVKLDGKLSFWAAGQDPSWAGEVFAVYASTDMENWEPLSDDITATGTMTEYTFDLTQFAGAQGYVAIRHYNISDMFRLNIDDIAITYVEPSEWIYVENLDAPNYTIEGLTPETTYEVQVQAINEGQTSAWTASTEFTTLEEEVIPTEQTAAPSIAADTQVGVHAYFVTITPSEESDLYYRFSKDNGEWSDWILYDGTIPFEEDGYYQVEAYAIANGKTESLHVTCSFVVTPRTGLDELSGDKAVSSVRFFNVAGQEMAQPNGMTIVVTTYTDGTTVASKVIK